MKGSAMALNFLSRLTGSFAMPAAENPTRLGMIVNQGIIGIKYWTGVDVEASVMRRELESFLAS